MIHGPNKPSKPSESKEEIYYYRCKNSLCWDFNKEVQIVKHFTDATKSEKCKTCNTRLMRIF